MAELQQEMINVLRRNGVKVDEQLTVQSMGSSMKLKTFTSKILTRTEGVYILKLTDVAAMQNVIAELEEAEISNIALIETKYSKKKELESELGIEAVRQAKQSAEELGGAMCKQRGKAIYINTWSMNEIVSPRNYKTMAARSAVMEEAADAAPAVNLSVTENEYSVDVNVRFELK